VFIAYNKKRNFKEISSHSKKALPSKVMKAQKGDGMLGFYPQSDIQHKWDGIAVSSTRRPHFIPKEIPWYLFLLEAEWATKLLNVGRKVFLKIPRNA